MNIRYIVSAGVAAVFMTIPLAHTAAEEESAERQVTLVGCLQRESDYRSQHGPGRSGPQGPGIGGRDEYVLIDARETTPGATVTSESELTCSTTGAGNRYELTGDGEEDLEQFLGRRVEITGTLKEADLTVDASGMTRPSGGFDPLGHELHLFEVEVESGRALMLARAEAPAAAAEFEGEAVEIAPPPQVAAEPPVIEEQPEIAAEAEIEQAPEAEPQPVGTMARQQQELPRTASPLPLAGLISLLSLAGAAGIRALRRRE